MAIEVSLQEAANLVRPTDSLGFGLLTGTPISFLTELSKRTDWENLTVSGGHLLGTYEMFLHPNVHYRASFFSAGERYYHEQGADTQFVPSYFRHYGLLTQMHNPRVMVTPCSMPDANGEASMSLYSGAHLEELRRCALDPDRILILQCSPHFPRTLGLDTFSNSINVRDADFVTYVDEKAPVFPNALGTEVDAKIAELALPFIPSGATLQTGIGAVPNLVAKALLDGDGGDYGIHSEMFTDGLFELMKAGKVNNSKKGIDVGMSVVTFAAGSQEMYDYIDNNPAVRMAPVFYTNNPDVIARNNKMVSINAALEVDLQGQLMADTIGGRQYSGIGGHHDFVEGTSLSLEHVSMICLESTANVKGELKSRIVGPVTPFSAVTTPRALSGVIITEYGVADLRGKTVRERTEAMISIAHPQFRDELREASEHLGF